MAPESADPHSAPDDTESYVGLSAEVARERAYERGWTTVRALEPDAITTMEYLGGRLNLAVKDETVVRCWKG